MKRNQPMKILLSIAGIGILFIGIYQFAFASTFGNGLFFESDRSAPVKIATSTQQGSSQPITNSSSSNTALASETVFNAQTLSAYNGKNGAPAYVAVNGIVYDMTGIGAWTNGQHQGYSAGQDLTATFSNSPHSEKMLTQLPIVGTFVSSVVKVDTPLVDSKTSATITAETQVTVPAESIALSPSSTTTSSDIWTYSILSKYNGVGGQPAYIAVNGVIYNVSSIGTWTGGVHHGIKAGQDVTAFFESSPHAASLLNTLPVVGKIGSPITVSNNSSASNVTTPDTTTGATISENQISDFDDDHDYDDHNANQRHDDSDDDHDDDEDHDQGHDD